MTATVSKPVTGQRADGEAVRRMRVAVVTPELHRRGGTERTTYELVSRLAREHEVCLIAREWELPADARLCVHRVRTAKGPGLVRFLSFYRNATRELKLAEMREGKFDVVYSPGPNCRGVQVVTAHFCQARQRELLRRSGDRPAPASWREALRRVHRWCYAQVVAWLEKRFYASPELQRVLTQSWLLAWDLHDYYGVPLKKIEVAYPGVDREMFNPEARMARRESARQELGLRPGESVFLFLGNNWAVKGLYHLLHAFREVPRGRLLVVGADVEPVESWSRLAERLGVKERVVFLPRREDVITYYAAADVLVAPSVYDTFGLMPLEAMACGLPCIITRKMGISELVQPGEALVIERAEEHERLAEAMWLFAPRDIAVVPSIIAPNGPELAKRCTWDAQYSAVLKELTAVARQSGLSIRQNSAGT
jgi:UDP-glucose:(heptosyl)LPS alpha-1,3-glucosyltransferase